MSDRLSWIEYQGARILYADYSGLSEEELLQTIEECKSELLKQAPGSVVTLTNVTNTTVTDKVSKKFKELAEQTRGISKGTAVIGVTGFKKAIAIQIRRDLHYVDSMEEAKEWLAKQAKSR